MFLSDLSKTAVYPNIHTFLDLDRLGLIPDTVTKGEHRGEGKSLKKENQIIIVHCVKCADPNESVINSGPLDPDPKLGMQILIQIREGTKRPTKKKKVQRKFQVMKCWKEKNSINIKHSGARRLPDVGGGQSCAGC
jgi:hypothetical protein